MQLDGSQPNFSLNLDAHCTTQFPNAVGRVEGKIDEVGGVGKKKDAVGALGRKKSMQLDGLGKKIDVVGFPKLANFKISMHSPPESALTLGVDVSLTHSIALILKLDLHTTVNALPAVECVENHRFRGG